MWPRNVYKDTELPLLTVVSPSTGASVSAEQALVFVVSGTGENDDTVKVTVSDSMGTMVSAQGVVVSSLWSVGPLDRPIFKMVC